MLDAIGWIGSLAFAVCAIPQAYKCYRDGHANGLDWGFLGVWFLGEVCMIAYIFPKQDIPLLVNYIGNFAALLVMLRYKLKPRG